MSIIIIPSVLFESLCSHVCSCMFMYLEDREHSNYIVILQEVSFFIEIGSLTDWRLPGRLGWLSKEPQGPSCNLVSICLHLPHFSIPSTVITRDPPYLFFFMGPRSSCLQVNHFTSWEISSVYLSKITFIYLFNVRRRFVCHIGSV